MTDDELIEKLADLEHARWSGWMAYQFTKGTHNPDGSFTIAADSVAWWMGLMRTPYAELTERSKESDRVEVRKTLAVLKECGR